MNLSNIIIAVCSLLFLMIGVDKFFPFMDPPCSLMDNISPLIWKFFGLLQLGAGIAIWFPKYRKYVAGFFFLFMIFFSIVHLFNNTYDIGGSLFMTVLLGILVWNPDFLGAKKK